MSVVITGRRMQASEMFMSGLGFAGPDRHFGSVRQQKLPVGDHHLTLLDTGLNDRYAVNGPLDFDRADDLDDADIILINSSNSIEFSVCRDQKHFKLILDSLNESIVSATVKKKSDKFILTLVKEAETSWFELRKSKK